MSKVYVPSTRQLCSNTGASLWFDIPKDLQAAANDIVERTLEDPNTSHAIQDLCDNIVEAGRDVRYSDELFIRVGSRRYGLYRANGIYRFNAGGENTSMPNDGDKELLLAYLSSTQVS